ncbi:ATP-binding cassette domain-containing protein [Subtercola boreus]|nr:ATP-binding cassette domain-containing protein [Subtercola boreus]
MSESTAVSRASHGLSELRITAGGETHVIPSNVRTVIGRGVECDVVVQHDLVSRRHAVVSYDGVWTIADNASTNGMYAGGLRTDSEKVHTRLEVRLGDATEGPMVVLEAVHVPAPEVTATRHNDDLEFTVLKGSMPQPFRSTPKRFDAVGPDSSVVTIGSAADNDIRLDDILVSRHHARASTAPGGLIVDDTNSLNGTYLNGQLISSAYLSEGDVLTIGHTDLLCREGRLALLRDVEPDSGGLQVSGLGYSITGGKKLLHDIDLTVKRGTLTAVIGPSGAGKSTLSRVLTGIAQPSTGTVEFDDFDVHASYELVRSRIGLVPQEDVMHRQLKVKRALDYSARLRLPSESTVADRQGQVGHVIDQLGLAGHESTRIDKLSGGQRKRASVALELLTEPSLLVLDEPTSGLDPALDQQVMKTLRSLADGDRAVIVITHSVAYLDLCDQILVLAPGGMPAFLGSPTDLTDFFGTNDWATIFGGVASDPEGSHRRYRTRFPSQPTPNAAPASESRLPTRNASLPRWSTQFVTLARRQVDVMVSDVGYISFLAALPIALGLLALVVPGHAGFTMPDPTDSNTAGEPAQLLALLTVGASFMGASMSIRDLVGERPIYLRERAVGLSVSAYLASKIAVFGLFAWLSSALLVSIVFLGKTPPESSVLFPDARIELFVAMGATATTSMVLGLLVSSLVRSSEQAMPVLIILLMAQLVLHGGIVPVTGRAVLDQLSWLMPARWGYAAAASGIDLTALVPSIDDDVLWQHDVGTWVLALCVLMAFSIVAASIALVRLGRSAQVGR